MVSYFVVYFTIMSLIGYIYESLAMTLWSGKWENRGFLYGPVIPIYGFGSLFGTILFEMILPSYSLWLVFIVGFFCSALLEFPTSILLEKLFHAVWWDYSSAPLNIQGRVSLFSSLGFGAGALIIVYLINPYLLPLLEGINHDLLELCGYISLSLLMIDITLTVSVLSSFENKVNAIQKSIDEHLDDAVVMLNPKGRNIKGALKYTKDNIIDNGVDKLYDSMDILYHGAISRIRGFRSSGSDTIQTIKSRIKSKVDKLRK